MMLNESPQREEKRLCLIWSEVAPCNTLTRLSEEAEKGECVDLNLRCLKSRYTTLRLCYPDMR